MDLKNAHYEAMRKLGYTDEEIEKDWEQVLKDLKSLDRDVRAKTPEPKPK
jgi:Holliday junction resolvasome RuvABC DNA-binding subunit